MHLKHARLPIPHDRKATPVDRTSLKIEIFHDRQSNGMRKLLILRADPYLLIPRMSGNLPFADKNADRSDN